MFVVEADQVVAALVLLLVLDQAAGEAGALDGSRWSFWLMNSPRL